MSDELAQLRQTLDVTRGMLAAKTLRVSELSGKIEAARAALNVYADYLYRGEQVWYEVPEQMQQAWAAFIEAMQDAWLALHKELEP